MLEPLRIATPASSRIYLGLATVGLGCGLIAALVAIAPAAAPARVVTTRKSTFLDPATAEPQPAADLAPRDPTPGELSLVFQLDGVSYVALAKLGAGDDLDSNVAAMPKHSKLKLGTERASGIISVVGAVERDDLPDRFQSWNDKRVTVDGSCTATVDGFAVVSRLVGDPGYAGLEATAWTPNTVLESGNPVLAARLDACASGSLARDADRPAILWPTVLDNPALAEAARKLVIDSEYGTAAAASWKNAAAEGAEVEGVWHEQATFDIDVLQHPTTKVTWVSVHAHHVEDCGGPYVNVFGLFRVEGEELVTVELHELDGMTEVDLFDLENDGMFELAGEDSAYDFVVKRADGGALGRLEVPFFGCPC
ncbi:MAG: hypothetical protein WKG01_08560 [Kofleriaceae bacterium]